MSLKALHPLGPTSKPEVDTKPRVPHPEAGENQARKERLNQG